MQDAQQLFEQLQELNLYSDGIVWVGAENPQRPSDLLDEMYEMQLLEPFMREGDYEYEELGELLFAYMSQGRLGYFVSMGWQVPQNFQFDANGEPASWSLGSRFRPAVFYGETLESCFKQATQWAQKEFAEEVALAKKENQ